MYYFYNCKNYHFEKNIDEDLKKKKSSFSPLRTTFRDSQRASCWLTGRAVSAASRVRLCVFLFQPLGAYPALTRWAQVEPSPQVKVKGRIKVLWRLPSFTRQQRTSTNVEKYPASVIEATENLNPPRPPH